MYLTKFYANVCCICKKNIFKKKKWKNALCDKVTGEWSYKYKKQLLKCEEKINKKQIGNQ